MTLLTMCLIARDEAENIERCFDSWWHDVDEVVLCDTGSTDDTIEIAQAFADRQGEPDKLKITRFDWVDDFAAARNHAETVATGEWVTWADFDDTIRGLANLRQMAADAASDVTAYFCHYDYARDEHGNCLSELWRERVVRRAHTVWKDRLHEHKLILSGQVIQIGPEIAQWVHHRDITDRSSGERNLRILEAWAKDEPDAPRVLSSLGLEYMSAERWADGENVWQRFLQTEGEQQDRRCQAARHLAICLHMQDKPEQARAVAMGSLNESWLWAETHLTLAEAEQALGNPQAGYAHAVTALQLGKPNTLLILNPLQFTAHPRALMAVCAAQLGRFEEAVNLGDEVMGLCPTYGLVAPNLPVWRGQLIKDQTVGTLVNLAQLLAGHDEVRKADRLLQDCVPYFVADDKRIIEQRVKVRAAIHDAAQRVIPTHEHDEAAENFVARHLAEAA